MSADQAPSQGSPTDLPISSESADLAEGADPGALEEELALVELVSRVLDRGAVLVGDVTISVAGVDLVHLFLNLTLTSTESLLSHRERGAPGGGDQAR